MKLNKKNVFVSAAFFLYNKNDVEPFHDREPECLKSK